MQSPSTAQAAEPESSPAASERRAFVRVAARELTWVRGARLKYGPSLSLIDVSTGGAQIESPVLLKPGSTVIVEIQGQDQDLAVKSRVVRCRLASISPRATYRGALAFAGELRMPGLEHAEPRLDADSELARLTLALRQLRTARLGAAKHDLSIVPDTNLTQVARTAVGAAAIALTIASTTPGGATVAFQLASLLRDVTKSIEDGDSPAAMLDRIDQRLWHALGVRIGMEVDAFYFDLPAVGGQRSARLLIEVFLQSKPTEIQFQVLKVAAHLVALVRGLDGSHGLLRRQDVARVADLRRSAREKERDNGEDLSAGVVPDEAGGPAGLVKIVVRYADGRLLKGFTRDFLSTKSHFHLFTHPRSSDAAPVTVLIGQVKAVFFVRDFEGNADHTAETSPAPQVPGRRIAVTFFDDEVLIGTTLNYRPDGCGFMVTPMDPRSNNERVFVVARSVRHVQFL